MLKLGILKNGIVTKNYPAGPADGYRGAPSVKPSLCNKCGKCVDACPSGAIHVSGSVEVSLDRCIFCAACRDACPTGALVITNDYELASRSKECMKVIY